MKGKAFAGAPQIRSNNQVAASLTAAQIIQNLPDMALPNWQDETEIGTFGDSEDDNLHVLAPLAAHIQAVEDEITRLVTTPIRVVADVAAHSLQAGGKRLRPALTILCAQLCGDSPVSPSRHVLTSAAVVELTHTTTLLHDDVVDEAASRRGCASANSVWGNQTSVLVGDYLFAQVFVTLAEPEFIGLIQPLALATARMCAGELQEIQARHSPDLDEAQYQEIIALKTASLIECACYLGAQSMQADEKIVHQLAQFGHHIGMAFQIIDDVLDLTADTGRLGKPVGHDIREGDITLPMLRALEQCNSQDSAELRAIIENEELEDAAVQRALELIRNSDAIAYSHDVAREYADKAKNILAKFPASDARNILEKIADYVVTRDH